MHNEFRSGKDCMRGGVLQQAVGYRKELSGSVVKISEGTEGNEFLFVKVNCYEKPVIFGVYYGAQEGSSGDAKIRRDLNELFAEMYKFDRLGYEVTLVGDFNVHIGSSATAWE